MGQRSRGQARYPNATAHVGVGILGSVLLISVFALRAGAWGQRVPWLVLGSAIWGLAYWLALTTPPRRQAVNSLLALVAVVVVLLQPAAALAVLAFVWAVRKAAMDREALPGRADSGSTAPRAAVSRAAVSRERPSQGSEPIAFPEMLESELLPFLSPATWRQQKEMACERLIAGYDSSPLVCLGWDSPRLVVIGGAQLMTPQNKATALANLRSRPGRAEWQETSMDLPDGSAEVFVRLGDVLTASDLWDPEFVRSAYLLAGSDRVYFGVPTRQSMVMATSPEPVARLAMSRVEDDEHGEFVVGAEVIAFDGDELMVLPPMLDGEDRVVRH